MAAQVVSAEKRYRISLLLDAYGELLTERQRTFLHLYYEEDLSYGEIAREYGVSRQAIFDSVKHGEEALEELEHALRLVETGWARLAVSGLTADDLVERLASIRKKLDRGDRRFPAATSELDQLIRQLTTDGET